MCNHYYITLFITITSDVLIKIFKNLIISISYMQFSRYMVMYHSFELCILFNWLNFYQSLENWNLILNFNSLITGKTSYHNSTSLLIRLAPISCCSSFACIYMNLPNICSGSASCSSIFIAWRPPTLPHRLQWSTIGRLSLNHRVRDGNGCYPQAHRHQ